MSSQKPDAGEGGFADAKTLAAPTIVTPKKTRAKADAPTVPMEDRDDSSVANSAHGFSLVSGESVSPHVDAAIGDIEPSPVVPRYDAGPLLGAGGMGEVRLHVDRRIGRRVAKKTLHGAIDSRTARRRFLREARVQGQLEHPAIVPVYDVDIDERGSLFFTMKRVRGLTLERVIDRLRMGEPDSARRFTQRKLLTAFAQVCLAIDYAHARGVVHRDLKPGNIMLGDFGEVYVLDWGLAKVLGEKEDLRSHSDPPSHVEQTIDEEPPPSAPVTGASDALTRHGTFLGTPAYMAPEQLLRRTEAVDTRADVFALGAILFEILTQRMLRPSSEVDHIVKHLRMGGDHVRPSTFISDVPPELDALCAQALIANPDERPARARDLADGIERYLDGEYDANLRRALADRHAAEADRLVNTVGQPANEEASSKKGSGADKKDSDADGASDGRVLALQNAMKALAFDPDHADAQKIVVRVLTDPTLGVPAAAERALDEAHHRARSRGAYFAFQGLLLWLAILPFVLIIGVRSWPVILLTSAVTLATALYSKHLSKSPQARTRDAVLLAVGVGGVVALTSCYMGPFAIVPTCAATASMMYAMHSVPKERRIATVILSIAATLPFVGELLGIFPPAYAFEADRIIVFARAIELPRGWTMAAMLYSTVSFVISEGVLIGRLRDNLTTIQDRQQIQAWYLRKLFPAGMSSAT